MKINREKLEWFLKNIRRKHEGTELTDSELVNEVANWMEVNPACIDMGEASHSGRFSYHTVGYGVYSLLGEKYRMGRVEIYDREDESGYATAEGIYTMPHIAANQFEDFIGTLRTDLPINIEIGNHNWCVTECEKELGIEKGMLHDAETVKAYNRKKNDEYAKERGYADWDELMANSIFAKNQKEDDKSSD